MKAKTIGYYKNVQNVGDVNAAVDLKVGMGVVLNRAARTANLPASEEEAKACFRIVSNINDKPEMRNFEETLTVKAGEKVRADDLTTVANLEMEFASYEISTDYAGISVGDKLVFGTDGLLAKSTDVTGYKVYFEVIKSWQLPATSTLLPERRRSVSRKILRIWLGRRLIILIWLMVSWMTRSRSSTTLNCKQRMTPEILWIPSTVTQCHDITKVSTLKVLERISLALLLTQAALTRFCERSVMLMMRGKMSTGKSVLAMHWQERTQKKSWQCTKNSSTYF